MENIYNNELINRISTLIRLKMKNNQITGASVSIVDGDGTIFSEGLGYTDKENKIEANNNTVFKIGSVSVY